MTSTPARKADPHWIGWLITLVIAVILIVSFGAYAPQILARMLQAAPHAPNWALWAALPWVIKLHIISALTALIIGCVILAQRKGSGLHKTLGWTWVVAMASTAISSLWINGLSNGAFSLIHLISGWTIVALPMGIFAIRNRNVLRHRRTMTGLFVGGLVVAGALTFVPGRFMFDFFF